MGINLHATTLNIILPVGISFYTFQALSYSIDVYRKNINPTKNIIDFFAYVSFFPQLVAGPIERATNLLPQFQKRRVFDYSAAVDGMRQILWGLFKKVVIADNCATYVDAVWGNYNNCSGSTLLLAAVLFTFQIYGDFSGYSDIAIGTAKLFGIRLMQNFKTPYFSRDIAEFWRRWHISLTTWFRDYIYIPLGGSRCSKAKIIRNTFVIFLVSGFWHGANWTFVLWGLYHALLFMPLILLGKNRKYLNQPSLKEMPQMILTFVLVLFGWIIFRSENISQAIDFMAGIFNNSILSHINIRAFVNSDIYIYYMLFALSFMLLIEWVFKGREDLVLKFSNQFLRWGTYILIFVLVFLLGSNSDSFIYFQF